MSKRVWSALALAAVVAAGMATAVVVTGGNEEPAAAATAAAPSSAVSTTPEPEYPLADVVRDDVYPAWDLAAHCIASPSDGCGAELAAMSRALAPIEQWSSDRMPDAGFVFLYAFEFRDRQAEYAATSCGQGYDYATSPDCSDDHLYLLKQLNDLTIELDAFCEEWRAEHRPDYTCLTFP